jgi:hypothetical protein
VVKSKHPKDKYCNEIGLGVHDINIVLGSRGSEYNSEGDWVLWMWTYVLQSSGSWNGR